MGDTTSVTSADDATILTDNQSITDDVKNSNVDGQSNTDDQSTQSPPDDKSEGDGTGAKGSDMPPDTYADFVLPEDMLLDEVALAEATPLFKELGLSQEQAQKVIDLYAKQVQAGSQKQIDDFNQLMSDWSTQAKNDSEFGGDKFEENVKIAQSAIAKYGTSELKQLLNDHGIGNHPEVIRFMVRVGHTLKEDVPGSNGVVSSKAEDRVSILYGNQNK